MTHGESAGDYELFCGLVFNGDRSEIRQANIVRQGIGAAFTDKLNLTWLRALSNAEDEAVAAFNVQGRRMAEPTDEDKERWTTDMEAEAEIAEIERLEKLEREAIAEMQTTPG